MKKKPIELFNMTDFADEWGVTRGQAFNYYIQNRLPDPDFKHHVDVFWGNIPEKPKPLPLGKPKGKKK